jgi:hypothetical protein
MTSDDVETIGDARDAWINVVRWLHPVIASLPEAERTAAFDALREEARGYDDYIRSGGEAPVSLWRDARKSAGGQSRCSVQRTAHVAETGWFAGSSSAVGERVPADLETRKTDHVAA